ncbi:hypothetical protein D3C80_1888230 [compost metagenome]
MRIQANAGKHDHQPTRQGQWQQAYKALKTVRAYADRFVQTVDKQYPDLAGSRAPVAEVPECLIGLMDKFRV